MSAVPDTPAGLAAANRAATIQHLRREIAFNRAEARRLRDEIYQLRLKAEQLEREADHWQRQLDTLSPPSTVLA